MSFNQRLKAYADDFNAILQKFCDELKCKPDILADSLRYSLLLGGKRLRPALAFSVADLLEVPRKEVEPFALAIELIHTYSLIHDDLPEMDDDDFRRGKPSNHRVFGVGNAVLAGDGLLNTAYSILLKECHKGNNYVSAAEFISCCAGIYGMIAGQSADLLHENDDSFDEDILQFIYENKTAKLLTAPLAVPSILAGGRYYAELKLFGSNLGALFQLTDDILDVEGSFEDMGKSIGKDFKEGKYTAVNLYGLHGAKLRADVLMDKCLKILDGIKGDTSFLKELVGFVRCRKN